MFKQRYNFGEITFINPNDFSGQILAARALTLAAAIVATMTMIPA
jgi:hypothetical protein